jgi:hypothetical protein
MTYKRESEHSGCSVASGDRRQEFHYSFKHGDAGCMHSLGDNIRDHRTPQAFKPI